MLFLHCFSALEALAMMRYINQFLHYIKKSTLDKDQLSGYRPVFAV